MAKKVSDTRITTVESLEAKLEVMREAQHAYEQFSQEEVDSIFRAAAMAANKARIPLAKMAVEETGMGVVEDKVIKNHYAAEYIYNTYRDTKTCGVIEEDKVAGIKKIAEPIGLVAAVSVLRRETRSSSAPIPAPRTAPSKRRGSCTRLPWRLARPRI